MNRVRIKICGLTDAAAITAAVVSGVDAIGFVFAASPRQVTPKQAANLARVIPPFVTTVAVFYQAEIAEIRSAMETFPADIVQTEPVDCLGSAIRTLPVFHDADDVVRCVARLTLPGSTVLFESAGRGGRGIEPDRSRAAEVARDRPIILAGGLTPANVAQAIEQVRPFAVDVSSGVESSQGVKDPSLIRAFVESVRCADPEKTLHPQAKNA
jgi:phosphoribosylanthranilate isomerase